MNSSAFRFVLVALAFVVWGTVVGCDLNSSSGSGSGGGDDSFVIKPSSAYLGTNDTTAAFRAEGGLPPYRWHLADTNVGSLVDTTLDASTRDATVVYAKGSTGSTASAVNEISVTDGRGWRASASIVQD